MVVIFAMASERSGTKYLAELFKHNIKRCVSKHEPFFFDMFGKPIYWYQQNEIEKIIIVLPEENNLAKIIMKKSTLLTICLWSFLRA